MCVICGSLGELINVLLPDYYGQRKLQPICPRCLQIKKDVMEIK